MYRRQSGPVRIAFMLIIIVASHEISSASMHCKGIVRDILMKKCKFGARIKRDTLNHDLDKMDYTVAKLGKIDMPELPATESRNIQRKRQLSAGSMIESVHISTGGGNVGHPVEAIKLKIREFRVPEGDASDKEREADIIERYFERSGSYSPMPYRSSLISAFRSSSLDDVLEFDLSTEELEELYNEISERSARNSKTSKDKAWDIFRETAAKCCADPKLCIEDTTLNQILCQGF